MQAFNVWLEVPEAKLRVIGKVISMLHNASLLHVFSFHSTLILLLTLLS